MKQFLRFYGAPIAIVLLGLLVAFLFMAPAPPKKVVIAGGAAGRAYAATAESYARALREQGVFLADIDQSVVDLHRKPRNRLLGCLDLAFVPADSPVRSASVLSSVSHS